MPLSLHVDALRVTLGDVVNTCRQEEKNEWFAVETECKVIAGLKFVKNFFLFGL